MPPPKQSHRGPRQPRDPKADASASGSPPPHPATVVQQKTPFGASGSPPPHPATVVQQKTPFGTSADRPPHPATVVQQKTVFGGSGGPPPRPATGARGAPIQPMFKSFFGSSKKKDTKKGEKVPEKVIVESSSTLSGPLTYDYVLKAQESGGAVTIKQQNGKDFGEASFVSTTSYHGRPKTWGTNHYDSGRAGSGVGAVVVYLIALAAEAEGAEYIEVSDANDGFINYFAIYVGFRADLGGPNGDLIGEVKHLLKYSKEHAEAKGWVLPTNVSNPGNGTLTRNTEVDPSTYTKWKKSAFERMTEDGVPEKWYEKHK